MLVPTKPSLSVTAFRDEGGMTLVEVLASLSLLMVLLGVLSQFLYTDVRLWGKNNNAFERGYQLRVLSQTFHNDLGSMVSGAFLAEASLQGDDYHFAFWAVKPDGLVQIQYRYDPSAQKVFRSAGFWGSKPQEKLVFDRVEDWKFEYYRPKTKNWELYWKPDQNKTDLPSLVRVTAKIHNNHAEMLVVPLPVWRNESDDHGT